MFFKRPLKADSTRATAASGKVGARNSPDKKPGVGSHCPTRIGLLPALDSRHRGAQDESRPFTKHVTIESNRT